VRRADRDVPRYLWRTILLGLLALCALHVTALGWACVTAGSLTPVIAAASGQDALTTQLLGLLLLTLTWVSKRQQNRTEALAGRGPAALHEKVDAIAGAHDTRGEQVAAMAAQVELLTELLCSGQARAGRHVPTGHLPVIPAPGGMSHLATRAHPNPDPVPPPPPVVMSWEQITTGDLPPIP